MIDLPKFQVGQYEINLIQGGMGVGISRNDLASAVANCGGLGVIASVGLSLTPNDYTGNFHDINKLILRDEIRTARQKTNGVIGVNIMRALTDYQGLVETSVEEGIDLIIVGAGISRDLPRLVQDESIGIVPVVSGARYAKLISKMWMRGSNGRPPDAIIVEGPKAGGHLGFDYMDLITDKVSTLDEIITEVVEFANDKNVFDTPVPVVAAGGVYSGKDIAHYHKLGAAGVQMATRFVTTRECDAPDEFKQKYLDSNEDDLKIVFSPVGMPGRIIVAGSFAQQVIKNEDIDVNCKYNCLDPCDPETVPYCIADALTNAYAGDFEKGFAFAGANAYRCTPETCLDDSGKFISVNTLMERLSQEYHENV